MTTVHESAADALLSTFLADPQGGELLATYSAGLREGRWDREYLEAIGQHRWENGRWPLEQVAVFARIHSEIMSGDVAEVEIGTAGNTPGPDSDRGGNAAALADLPAPFTALVDAGQNCAGQDGWLSWSEPIIMSVSTGSPVTEPGGTTYPETAECLIAPGRVPLEIGTTKPSNTLLHLRSHRGVGRWAYGHDRILLLVSLRAVGKRKNNPMKGIGL